MRVVRQSKKIGPKVPKLVQAAPSPPRQVSSTSKSSGRRHLSSLRFLTTIAPKGGSQVQHTFRMRPFLSETDTFLSQLRPFLSESDTFLSRLRSFLSRPRTFLTALRTFLIGLCPFPTETDQLLSRVDNLVSRDYKHLPQMKQQMRDLAAHLSPDYEPVVDK